MSNNVSPWTAVVVAGGKLEITVDQLAELVQINGQDVKYRRRGPRIIFSYADGSTDLAWDACTSTGHTPGDWASFKSSLDSTIDAATTGSTAPSGVLDSNNSSTATLGASETFTGDWFNATEYSMGNFTISASAGSSGTLYIDVSNDGVNSNGGLSAAYNQGPIPQLKALAVAYPYYRVRYVNGSVATTSFYVTVIWHRNKSKEITQTINGTLATTTDTLLSRRVNDWFTDVARGKFRGISVVNKFGNNPDVDDFDAAATAETVWYGGGLYTFPTTAETIRVQAGGNAADDAGGAGARTITVNGLDENWEEASEVLTLAGALASAASTTTFIRINTAYVTDCGTYNAGNTGDITIENTITNNTLAIIAAEKGRTQLGMYSVPAGKTAYILNFSVSANRTGSTATNVVVDLYTHADADVSTAPFTGRQIRGNYSSNLGAISTDPGRIPIVLTEKSDIEPIVSYCNQANVSVNVFYDILLFDN